MQCLLSSKRIYAGIGSLREIHKFQNSYPVTIYRPSIDKVVAGKLLKLQRKLERFKWKNGFVKRDKKNSYQDHRNKN